MVHVHGRRVQQLVEPLRRIPPEQVIAVAVDAGKSTAVALVADFTGEISREGSVGLRRALLELAQGLRHHDRAARAYAAGLADRGKHSMIIWTALANRANRIAFAMVRDQTVYDPACWR